MEDTIKKKNTLWILIPAAGAVALLVGVWLGWGPIRTPAGQPPLTMLTPENLAKFQEDFNQPAGTARLLLLFSPT